MPPDDTIREEAAGWAVRTGDPHFADWEDFTDWLERDPAHAAAYDRVTSVVAEAAEASREAQFAAANDDVPQPGVSRRWFGGAFAAALVAAVLFGVWFDGSSPYSIETAPGETQLIALGDGSSIELAGGTRVTLDRDDPRFAELDYGRALFTIRHDEAHPFELQAGQHRLLDAGTVFDVRLGDAGLSVGVSEGAVIFEPDSEAVRIAPGQLLQLRAGAREIVLRDIAVEQVGEWREGRLTFEQATIAEIAGDLTSATGLQFTAATGSGDREVSGSLLVDPIRREPASLGPLLGLEVRPAGEGWVIEAE